MVTSHLFIGSILALALVMSAHGAVAAQEHRLSEPDDVAALQVFERSVEKYVALRRRLEPSLPPLRVSSDPEEIGAAVDALANAIRTARAGAHSEDIFGAEVVELFRVRIERTLAAKGHDVEDLLADVNEEASPDAGRVAVNGRFPWGRGVVMWPAILRALPQLPPELQYRFVDRDLVLVDIDAGLVVDVLEGALQVTGFREPVHPHILRPLEIAQHDEQHAARLGRIEGVRNIGRHAHDGPGRRTGR